MKHTSSCLVFFAILFTLAISAPLERGHHAMLHRQSPHRGLSHRIRGAYANTKQPAKLNLTFTPINSGDVSAHHVDYDASTQLQTSDVRFSATLQRLGRDDNMADVENPFGRDTQVGFRLEDAYGGRHVVISAPDLVIWALQQRGVSQDDMPQYVRQSVHVTDPSTGDQYQLVPDGNPEDPVFIDSRTIMISLNMNK